MRLVNRWVEMCPSSSMSWVGSVVFARASSSVTMWQPAHPDEWYSPGILGPSLYRWQARHICSKTGKKARATGSVRSGGASSGICSSEATCSGGRLLGVCSSTASTTA